MAPTGKVICRRGIIAHGSRNLRIEHPFYEKRRDDKRNIDVVFRPIYSFFDKRPQKKRRQKIHEMCELHGFTTCFHILFQSIFLGSEYGAQLESQKSISQYHDARLLRLKIIINPSNTAKSRGGCLFASFNPNTGRERIEEVMPPNPQSMSRSRVYRYSVGCSTIVLEYVPTIHEYCYGFRTFMDRIGEVSLLWRSQDHRSSSAVAHRRIDSDCFGCSITIEGEIELRGRESSTASVIYGRPTLCDNWKVVQSYGYLDHANTYGYFSNKRGRDPYAVYRIPVHSGFNWLVNGIFIDPTIADS